MTAWTDAQWDAFVGLLAEGWHGPFTDESAAAWRVMLDGLDPQQAVEGLRRLLQEGRPHRPSASELLAAARHDPSQPTADEALRLIYGRGGVLRAQPEFRPVWRGHELADATRQARLDRARELHPLVDSFVARQGLDRLAQIPIDDPDWGDKHRRDLERAWASHVEAHEGREVAALAAGTGHEGLHQLDPLAALGGPARELPPGDEEPSS